MNLYDEVQQHPQRHQDTGDVNSSPIHEQVHAQHVQQHANEAEHASTRDQSIRPSTLVPTSYLQQHRQAQDYALLGTIHLKESDSASAYGEQLTHAQYEEIELDINEAKSAQTSTSTNTRQLAFLQHRQAQKYAVLGTVHLKDSNTAPVYEDV